MLENIAYRLLEYHACEKIKEIDASQYIERALRKVDGILQMIPIHYQDPDFSDGYENHLAALKETIKNGGRAIGAFLGEKLIGFSSVNSNIFGSQYQYVLLDQIFISLTYRRKGIGKELFAYSVNEAWCR